MNAVKKIKALQEGTLFLVQGKDGGQSAWHYVLVGRLKLVLFKQKLKNGELDVAQYGRILHSGWGEKPPAELAQEMKQVYS
jgi:hypothetical protein